MCILGTQVAQAFGWWKTGKHVKNCFSAVITYGGYQFVEQRAVQDTSSSEGRGKIKELVRIRRKLIR